ncbi:hypothetical protein FBUS_05562 [Fasciolopsis buskii]|uniref:EF-hand domain-containing protein n=1 Tax=Fasciolopsis buskii TaxID=27845 RepID=A0A8E0VEZ7_9TREM|nr:hypothetical protein FBUS_05562 [Fasciolopsis buski]
MERNHYRCGDLQCARSSFFHSTCDEWAQKILRELDRDKNGKLSREEILISCPNEEKKQELSELFDKFDENGDQQIDVIELSKWIRCQFNL